MFDQDLSHPPLMRFQSSLPAAFHRSLVDELDAMNADELGHEMAFLLPGIRAIVEDKVVLGAVDLLLPNARLDSCMHIHLNHGLEDGAWHADALCLLPCSEPIVLLCYFPQDTPPEMGPTEVRWRDQHLSAAGPAGTCLLIKQDSLTMALYQSGSPDAVTHRATANPTGRKRYMLKFLFITSVPW